VHVSDDTRVGTELAGYRIESLLGWGGIARAGRNLSTSLLERGSPTRVRKRLQDPRRTGFFCCCLPRRASGPVNGSRPSSEAQERHVRVFGGGAHPTQAKGAARTLKGWRAAPPHRLLTGARRAVRRQGGPARR
jgi:hypothetical protein